MLLQKPVLILSLDQLYVFEYPLKVLFLLLNCPSLNVLNWVVLQCPELCSATPRPICCKGGSGGCVFPSSVKPDCRKPFLWEVFRGHNNLAAAAVCGFCLAVFSFF